MQQIPFWKIWPFTRILPLLILGILLQYYLQLPLWPSLALAGLTTAFLALLPRMDIHRQYSLRKWQGMALYLLIVALGSTCTFLSIAPNHANWVGHSYQPGNILLLQMTEPGTQRAKGWRYKAVVKGTWQQGVLQKRSGTVIVYQRYNGPPFRVGSFISTRNTLLPIPSNANPGGFDYALYSARKGIYHSLTLHNEKEAVTQPAPAKSAWLEACRQWIIHTCKKYIPNRDEYGIVTALLIGHKEDLDETLMDAYSRTGVIHVIAISGMHLAMVYGLVLWLLRPVQRIRAARIITPLLTLVALWSFTLLTGAGPSVLRAAVICTSLCLGNLLRAEGQGINSLAASAACLLVYNPLFLWDVGFQLSFTAVGGILAFAQPLYRLLYLPNRWLQYIWQTSSVTLAAQIFTLPVILYHFHQFPNLFLVSNLVVVPLSGILLYSAIGMLIIAPFTWLANIVGQLVSWLCGIMNGFVQYINDTSWTVTEHILMHPAQVLLYFILILLLWKWKVEENIQWLFRTLYLLLVFLGLRAVQHWQIHQKQQLVIYQVPGRLALDLIAGSHYIFLGDTSQLVKTDRQLQSARTQSGAWKRQSLHMISGNTSFITGSWQIHVIHDKHIHVQPQTHQRQQLVIMGASAASSLLPLSKLIPNAMYVFDSSSPLWKIEKWKKEADSLHLRHHSVPKQGAFQMEL